MIPKVEATLSGNIKVLFIAWFGFKGATYRDHFDSNYGTGRMMSGSELMSLLMMVLACVDMPMLLTSPDRNSGNSRHIEGGEGVGEDGLNDLQV